LAAALKLNLDQIIAMQNDERVLKEGDVMRYSPGISNDFISRYVILTNKSMKYYKNELQSINQVAAASSLIFIPLGNIERA